MSIIGERWAADGGTIRILSNDSVIGHFRDSTTGIDQDDARAELAAAAPDMARMLLAHEWGGSLENSYGEVISPACVECQGIPEEPPENVPEDGTHWHVGHFRSCGWVALMERTGVR